MFVLNNRVTTDRKIFVYIYINFIGNVIISRKKLIVFVKEIPEILYYEII